MTKYWGLAGLRLGYAIAAPADGRGAARRGPALERQRLRPGGRRRRARRPRSSRLGGRAARRRARPPRRRAPRARLDHGADHRRLLPHPRRRCRGRAPGPARPGLPRPRLHVVRPARARPRQPAPSRAERPAARGVLGARRRRMPARADRARPRPRDDASARPRRHAPGHRLARRQDRAGRGAVPHLRAPRPTASRRSRRRTWRSTRSSPPDGGEMGRAQVYQARAAGLEPHVDMNPVLLKPSSDATSQVVVHGPAGRAHDGARVPAPTRRRSGPPSPPPSSACARRTTSSSSRAPAARPRSTCAATTSSTCAWRCTPARPSCSSATSTAAACSPACSGTWSCSRRRSATLVAGFVINKFRGDASLLDSGHRDPAGSAPASRRSAWCPCSRDGAATRRTRSRSTTGGAGRSRTRRCSIAVVRLPFISNSTDFDALAAEPDVDVRFVSVAGGAGRSRGDRAAGHQEHDRRPRLAAGARAGGGGAGGGRRRHAGGRRLRRLPDARPPHPRPRARRVGRRRGRRPRPARRRDDLRRRASGPSASRASCSASSGRTRPSGPAGTPVRGYEIHMGRTELGPGAAPLLRLRGAGEAEHVDGAAAGAVCGTYLHGLFDHPELRAAFLNRLRAARGLAPRPRGLPPRGGRPRPPRRPRRGAPRHRRARRHHLGLEGFARRACGHRPHRRRGAPARRHRPRTR